MIKIRICILIFIGLILCLSLHAAENTDSDTIVVPCSQGFMFHVAGKFKVLIDSTNQKKVSGIYTQDDCFNEPQYPDHLGRANVSFWLKFYIKNNCDQSVPLILNMENLHTDKFELYTLKDDTITAIAQIGDIYPHSQRPINSRTLVIPFEVLDGEVQTFYLLLYNKEEPVSLPLYLSDPNSYLFNENRFITMLSIGIGGLFVFAFIGLFIFAINHHILYLYYALYVCGIVFWLISNYGLGFQWLWSDSVNWHFKSTTFFAGYYVFMFMLFTTAFLPLKKYYIRLYILCISSAVVGGILLIVFASINLEFFSKVSGVFWFLFYAITVIALGLIALSIVLVIIKSSNIIYKIYAFVYLIMLFALCLLVLREIVVLPVNSFTEHCIFIGVIAEVSFIAFALAFNINSVFLERQRLLIEKNEHQKALLFAEIQAGEKERKKIAQDLHDDLGMLLTSAKLALNRHESTNKVVSMLDQSIEKVQNITRELHPSIIQQFGLIPALEEVLYAISLSIPANLTYRFDEKISIPDKDKQVNIYRIVSELLNNAIKHSNADIIFVQIKHKETDFIEISVKDNGCGFDTNQKNKSGLGLKSMESRVQLMKGDFTINSNTDTGTEIHIYIPA